MMLESFIKNNKLDLVFEKNALHFYIPLARRLVEKRSRTNGTFFVGINGCQGSGKSTLVSFLAEYIQENYSLSVAVLSLDDFYLEHAVRKQMASDIHPLFSVRGVPGTHDTQLIKDIFESLAKSTQQIALPRFDKASDNPVCKNDWPLIQAPVDIVLMEGWCWGVPPQSQEMLLLPVNDLERRQDQQAVWRNRVNQTISEEHLPLYQQMSYWIMLKAPGFSNVLEWRIEQEKKMATNIPDGEMIMSDEQIRHFVKYYQRLTEYCFNVIPNRCNKVFQLDNQRNIVQADKTN